MATLLGNEEDIDANIFPLISIRSEDRLQLLKYVYLHCIHLILLIVSVKSCVSYVG